MGLRSHRKAAPSSVRLGVITVSSTRTLADDKGGHWISKQARKEGHAVVYHQVVPDDRVAIAQRLPEVIEAYEPQAVVLTGGTGIGPQDVTIEAVRPLFEKELTAFGVLFAQLSFEEIDSAAILSRATAGTIGPIVIFCIPGSLKACKLACRALIFPELGHLVKHALEG